MILSDDLRLSWAYAGSGKQMILRCLKELCFLVSGIAADR
jgi:hypothetical protein